MYGERRNVHKWNALTGYFSVAKFKLFLCDAHSAECVGSHTERTPKRCYRLIFERCSDICRNISNNGIKYEFERYYC